MQNLRTRLSPVKIESITPCRGNAGQMDELSVFRMDIFYTRAEGQNQIVPGFKPVAPRRQTRPRS
jgi:hypothetical protein